MYQQRRSPNGAQSSNKSLNKGQVNGIRRFSRRALQNAKAIHDDVDFIRSQ
jgi:hypothetical protein